MSSVVALAGVVGTRFGAFVDPKRKKEAAARKAAEREAAALEAGLDGGLEGGEGGLGGLGGRKKKWSAQEDELLREQFEAHKELDDWHHIVAALLAPRTAAKIKSQSRFRDAYWLAARARNHIVRLLYPWIILVEPRL